MTVVKKPAQKTTSKKTVKKTSASHSSKTPKPILTKEQLLSSTEYMSDDQLEFFRNLLLLEKNNLLAAASKTTNNLQKNESTPDWTDRATVEEEHALELRVRDRERKLLKKIEQALERIADGSYGWCEETGDPIGIPRLLARPTASLSIEAQERHEKLERIQKD